MSTSSTHLGRDVSAFIPPADAVPALVRLRPEDDAVWQFAAPHLHVRNNDEHTLYAYGLARALLAVLPDADPDVVLPAILLHDTGWSSVPDAEILEAIAPGGGRADLVRHHEVQGAAIARAALNSLGRPDEIVAEVSAIIDGHDSRLEALSLNDAIVKDADKLWRVTPHGISTVCGWFSIDPGEALRLCASRVTDALFSPEARSIAHGLIAVASVNLSPQLAALTEKH